MLYFSCNNVYVVCNIVQSLLTMQMSNMVGGNVSTTTIFLHMALFPTYNVIILPKTLESPELQGILGVVNK